MGPILRDFISPFFWRCFSRFGKLRGSHANSEQNFEYGVEQPAEFYDQRYEKGAHWKKHYTDSHYYPLWTVIADHIRQIGCKRILDIGCGPGQVACLLRDIGVPEYTGLDFSPARVARARTVCPEYEFILANVFEDNLLETDPYDCILMMEFLEHIEQDIEVLKRIRPGVTVLATVPDFPSAGHVRHFANVAEVKARYTPLFNPLEILEILTKQEKKTYYILQGIKRGQEE